MSASVGCLASTGGIWYTGQGLTLGDCSRRGSCIARERLAGPHQAGLASYCLSYCGQVGVGGNLAEISGSVLRRARYCEDTCSQPDIEGLKSAKVRTCPASAFCNQGGCR